MARSFLLLRWRTVAAIAFAASAVTASACSNSGTNAIQASPQQRIANQTISYSYYKVDYPNASGNEVTGINDLQEIVGSYSPNGSSDSISSYTSTPNPTTPGTYGVFTDASYPLADKSNTYTWAISPGTTPGPSLEAGWALKVGGFASSTWGIFNNQGIWTVMHPDHNEKNCAPSATVMELLGVNDAGTAVGYYTQTPPYLCTITTAFEILSGESMVDISGLGSYYASEATGINDQNTVVGWGKTTASSVPVGWFKKNRVPPAPMPFLSGAVTVIPFGINNSGMIVGEYTDGSKNSHGFVYTPPPGSGSGVYQTIDFPCTGCSNAETIVYGINDGNAICGSYVGKDSNQHGFVAIPQQGPLRRRAAQSHSPRSLPAFSARPSP
jgi:hypothetical protein